MGGTEVNFDGEIPRNYDRYLGPVLFGPFADDLADRLPAIEPDEVLELACGTGILTRRLLQHLPPTARIIATDLSPQMLDYAEGRIGSSERVQWRQADATTLPFSDSSFDVVACQFGVMFFPDKPAALSEVRRVLRAGGSFLFNVWDRLEDNAISRIADRTLRERFPGDAPEFLSIPHGYHESEVIRANLDGAGFRDVKITKVGKGGEGASARDLAAGLITGTPLKNRLQERGVTDLDELIETLAVRIGQECGDPIRDARMSALVVTAKAEG